MTPKETLPLTERPAWKALTGHFHQVGDLHLRQLFKDDPGRGERLTAQAVGLYLDYSKHRLTDETFKLLLQLAAESGLKDRIDAMFRGEKINVTEKRAVLHVALRAPKGAAIMVDGDNVVPLVHAVLDKMTGFSQKMRSWRLARPLVAGDPLISGVRRHKYYSYLYLPSPRPNQSVFLYNKKTAHLKHLWSLPNAKVMAIVSEMPTVDKKWQRTKNWCDSFFDGSFWHTIRDMHKITMPSETEYLNANREKLIQAGCKVPQTRFTDPFDFSKVSINKIVDTKTASAE